MQFEALPFKMTSLQSRFYDERVLVCRSHLLQNCKIQHCGRVRVSSSKCKPLRQLQISRSEWAHGD